MDNLGMMITGKALTQGIFAYLGNLFVFGQNVDQVVTLRFLNMTIPDALAIGGAGVIASMVADALHQTIEPLIPINDKFSNARSMVVTSSIYAASASGLLWYFAQLPAVNVPTVSLFFAGQYVATEFLMTRVFMKDEQDLF